MSYSLDFRKHVFKIRKRDSLTFGQTGERFGIFPRILFKWKKCMEPKPQQTGHQNRHGNLTKACEDCPDSYQHERAAHFGVSYTLQNQ